MIRTSRKQLAGSRKNKQWKAKGTRKEFMSFASDIDQSLSNTYECVRLKTKQIDFGMKPNHPARAVDISTCLVKLPQTRLAEMLKEQSK